VLRRSIPIFDPASGVVACEGDDEQGSCGGEDVPERLTPNRSTVSILRRAHRWARRTESADVRPEDRRLATARRRRRSATDRRFGVLAAQHTRADRLGRPCTSYSLVRCVLGAADSVPGASLSDVSSLPAWRACRSPTCLGRGHSVGTFWALASSLTVWSWLVSWSLLRGRRRLRCRRIPRRRVAAPAPVRVRSGRWRGRPTPPIVRWSGGGR
jgi:hypothetical protein